MREIIIRDEKYLEEENPVSFVINKFNNAKHPTEEDKIERKYLLNMLNEYCTMYMDNDLNTRRVVLQPKYDGNENLASCMSMIQFLVRDNTVNCYCTMRSEIDTTHDWDCDTLFYLTEYICDRYLIDKINIVMTVNSFHKKFDIV